jgi:hypothetical protein
MSLPTYHSKYGYDGTGAKERLVAKIQDIKASPEAGKKRLIIRETTKTMSHAAIDIDMKYARDLEEKGTYVFEVEEKDNSRNPGFQRKKGSSFRSYYCHEEPDLYTPESDRRELMNRFGGGGSAKGGSRTKFSTT